MSRSDAQVALGAILRLVDACRRRGATLPRPDSEPGEASDAGGSVRVSEKQVRILRQLDDRDPAMVGELADFLGVTPSTMSLNLTRLEAAGLVSRSRDPDDRRVMNVLLTDRGRRLRDAAAPFDPRRTDALLALLRPDERARALDGLALLAEAADRLTARGDAYLDALSGADAPNGPAGHGVEA